MPPTSANSSGAQAAPPASPSPASDDSDDLNDAPSPEWPDTPQDRVVNELAAEAANLALERLGDRYIDYLVDNGLSRPHAEDIVTTGFHAAGRCSLEAMREQAQVESVPLDTVLRALHAELYDTDGPILMRTIDLQAVAAREAPCALNALQEAGIPPSVAAEIQRAALSE